jgi:hypothetical protein
VAQVGLASALQQLVFIFSCSFNPTNTLNRSHTTRPSCTFNARARPLFGKY